MPQLRSVCSTVFEVHPERRYKESGNTLPLSFSERARVRGPSSKIFGRRTFGFLRGLQEHHIVIGSMGLTTLDACHGNTISLNDRGPREKPPETLSK